MKKQTLHNEWIRPALSPANTTLEAQTMFAKFKCSELPVIADGNCLGTIHEKQLYQQLPNETIGNQTLAPPTALDYKASPAKIWQNLLDHQCNVVVLMDERKQYVGFVNAYDVLTAYEQLLGLGEMQCIVVLRMRKMDYSLAKLGQLAEEASCQILNVFITQSDTEEHVYVNLDVHCDQPDGFVQSLERHELEVAKIWCKTEQDDALQERLDMLMNYLNV